jgi:hypothetical protein
VFVFVFILYRTQVLYREAYNMCTTIYIIQCVLVFVLFILYRTQVLYEVLVAYNICTTIQYSENVSLIIHDVPVVIGVH